MTGLGLRRTWPFVAMQTRWKFGMKKFVWGIAVLAILAVGGFWIFTAPWAWSLVHPARDTPDASPGNILNGAILFRSADCATCHATPNQPDVTRLGGGKTLQSAFGTFYMPNISSDPHDGIGAWSPAQFIRALREGVSPHGESEYPALPYTSYQRMTANDLKDMLAYIKTLPPVQGKVRDHDLKFPFTIRRVVGAWRMLFLDGKPLAPAPDKDAQWLRGRYLVEGAAHCAECHSPRNALGAIRESQRFAGGLSPDGSAYIPNITPDDTGIGYWSVNEIAHYLKDGLTPLGTRAGGDMAEIVAQTAQLSNDDRLAIATYLKSVPAVDAPAPGIPEPNRTSEVVTLPKTPGGGNTSALASLAAPAGSLVAAQDVYVVTTRPFFLLPGHLNDSGAQPDGKFLGATRLSIVSRQGDAIQVRLAGWQQEGSDSTLYAREGQRILQAVLAPTAVKAVTLGAPVIDKTSGQKWRPATFTAWIKPEGLNTDLATLWQHSQGVFNATCSACHSVPTVNAYLANQWVGTLKSMKRYTNLTDDDYRLLLVYLQEHAKDAEPALQTAKP
jgi:mono/diheme cytochrome c family protein